MKDLYNIKNRDVNVFDQYLELGSIQRVTKKWYKKVLYYGIEAAIIKSKLICDKRYGKETTIIEFRERIINCILINIIILR